MHSRAQPLVMASVVIVAVLACRGRGTESTSRGSALEDRPGDPSSEVRRSEQRATERDARRVCERPTLVYEGAIDVESTAYVHPVERGGDYVDEAIEGLDKVVSTSPHVRFTLDYPFERPFAGTVAGEVTLRRTIDAIRAGFRKMYEGSAQRDIPGMHNKDVTGPYGRAFHAIEDLVIERIELCADDSFSIFIGS